MFNLCCNNNQGHVHPLLCTLGVLDWLIVVPVYVNINVQFTRCLIKGTGIYFTVHAYMPV